MSRRSCALVVVLLSLPAHPAVARQATSDTLLALEHRLAAALTSKDAATFDELLGDSFVLRGAPDVSRETWIANAVKLCWGDRYDLVDFRVIDENGRSAIVSFVLTTYRDPETCERATIRSLVTDVWRAQGGAWRLALRHAGPAGGGLAQQFLRESAPPPRWERSGELSLVSTGGNTETRTLGVGGAVTWRPGRWRTDARAGFVRSDTDGVRTAESLTLDLRQSRALGHRLEAFARAAFLVNEFAGIDGRLTADAGLGIRLRDTGAHRLRVDAGAGYSREARLSGQVERNALGTLGAAYRWRLTRLTEFTDNALFTASLDETGDWRLQNAAALSTAMTRVLSIRLSHELRIVNAPVPGFDKRDTVIAVALVARF